MPHFIAECTDNIREQADLPGLFAKVNEALAAAGFKGDEAEVAMIPSISAPVADLETAQKVLKLIDMLEDLDDVQNVYHNAEIPDEIMEQLD